jgi:DeoR/GlpR family transcriptional regulator of sugar metabolism
MSKTLITLSKMSKMVYDDVMIDLEREEQILALLNEKTACTVYELAQKLYVSESTVRRDLTRMEQKGLVTRTFGGVIIRKAAGIDDSSFFLREKENLQEKRALVKEASSFIQSNTALFIDSSTTCLQIVSLLNDFHNLLIITNGLTIANEIVTKTRHRVTLLGGTIQPSTNSVLGARTEKMIAGYHANLAILSTYSLDPEFGFSEQTEEQADLKKIMISNSDKAIVLVGSGKVDYKALTKTCDISDISVIISANHLPDIYHQKAPKTQFITLNKLI